MYLQQFFIDGLGCASYLLGCEVDKQAAVIDPERDVQKYLDAAAEQGLRITHIIETHLHADHISGSTELAARTGAPIYIHAAAQAEFAHQALRDGQVLALGSVRLAVRHTPGHTPESITLLVSDTTRAEQPWLALTGDLLFVGDAGRPDLVEAEEARALAGQLYESLFHNLLEESDHLLVYPAHGAGSLCGRAIASLRSSSLGYEKQANPALQVREKQEFIQYSTTNLPEQPGSHHHIKATNRAGPRLLGKMEPRPLTVQAAAEHIERGAVLLDTRPKADFMPNHVPGALNLPGDEELSNRAGFVLSPDAPLVLLLADESKDTAVVYSLARVGFENVTGFIEGGLPAWQARGLPTTGGDLEDIQPARLSRLLENGARPLVLDVRQPWEYEANHIPQARLIPLGELAGRLPELDPQQPVAVICKTGSRSQTAAALLVHQQFNKVYLVQGGMTAWQESGFEVVSEIPR